MRGTQNKLPGTLPGTHFGVANAKLTLLRVYLLSRFLETWLLESSPVKRHIQNNIIL